MSPATQPAAADPPGWLPVERFAAIEPKLKGLWLVKRLLPAAGVALIYGHPNCGKSFFAIDIGLRVSLGWDCFGRKVRQGLVVYVGAEGVNGLRNRIAAFRQHHGVEAAPFSLVPCPINMQAPDADVLRLGQLIRREAAHFGAEPVLIVIDTLSKTFGAGKENTDDMASYVANCERISAAFKCCVMPIHHRPKDAESTDPRGHSSLKGGLDTTILIEAGRTKAAEIVKQRDGEIGERLLFNLTVIELGEDEDGDPVTSCIVEATEANLNPAADPFARAVARISAGTRLVYDQLGELLEASGTAIPTEIPNGEIDHLHVGKVAVLDEWRDKSILAAGTGAGHKPETGKKAFNRALVSLRKAGIVRVWGNWAWITYHIAGEQPGQAGTAPGQAPGHDRDSGTAGTGVFRPVPMSRPPESAQSRLVLAPGEAGDDVDL